MLKGSCHCGNGKWTLEGDPGSITACNCTLCRRYGALWAYDYEGERIAVSGELTAYSRADEKDPTLEILFCPTCGCVVAWRGLQLDGDGRRRIAVNVRLTSPELVADLPVDYFDGFDTFEDLPSRGTCVRDLWF
ncbi:MULTISPECIES: GFA family protein [unclassified Ensifer]|uniref:GFA family protein n=1 Tax=unclassified Ensifer TaxID=2633371 RepID=UPI00081394FC|nr:MULTISPECIES: GFA family protein [unclassified Ensifer]OCP01838.1 aldehyde-activating protein [Ensifer sp. LC14]OCP04621.1 aldehyde-activating protein [Ensifer sp. LC11]OCP09627.1 aldehyde-activating protein [Ensifer sp. LC13]OCP30674.1 aldehyde-activating protein [Ensifer sp. LC499]